MLVLHVVLYNIETVVFQPLSFRSTVALYLRNVVRSAVTKNISIYRRCYHSNLPLRNISNFFWSTVVEYSELQSISIYRRNAVRYTSVTNLSIYRRKEIRSIVAKIFRCTVAKNIPIYRRNAVRSTVAKNSYPSYYRIRYPWLLKPFKKR